LSFMVCHWIFRTRLVGDNLLLVTVISKEHRGAAARGSDLTPDHGACH
jgi:hypothetical protein